MSTKLLTMAAGLLLLTAGGCGEVAPFAPAVGGYKVTFAQGSPTQPGTAESPRKVPTTAEQFTLDIEALRPDLPGQVLDSTYNGWAIISVVPTGKLDLDPFPVQLKNGKASGVKVNVKLAYGKVRRWSPTWATCRPRT